MDQDWLLVETLGTEPVVVAQGRRMKNLVPITAFLRRHPHRAAIQTAITETVIAGTSLASITPKSDRVIRTEPVTMSDGKVHGVHVWIGPADAEPPQRPIPGPLIWDMTAGEATDTVESLTNSGMNPAQERTHGRAFVEDLPSRDLHKNEARVLAMAVDTAPGRTYCSSWDFNDKLGGFRRVGFVVRTAMEPAADGTEHLIARAMNLVGELDETDIPTGLLAQRILKGLSQRGVYRRSSTWAAGICSSGSTSRARITTGARVCSSIPTTGRSSNRWSRSSKPVRPVGFCGSPPTAADGCRCISWPTASNWTTACSPG